MAFLEEAWVAMTADESGTPLPSRSAHIRGLNFLFSNLVVSRENGFSV